MRAILCLILTAFALVSCKKETVHTPIVTPEPPQNVPLTAGLPPRPDSLSGYVSVNRAFGRQLTSYNVYWENKWSMAATFSDPATDLYNYFDHENGNDYMLVKEGNMAMGDVAFNGTVIPQNYWGRGSSYLLTYVEATGQNNIYKTTAKINHLVLSVDGNSLVPGFAIHGADLFPDFTDTITSITIKKGQGLNIDVRKFFNRWDSIQVMVTDNYSTTYQYSTSRSGDSARFNFSFPAAELDYFVNGVYCALVARATRYYYKVVAGRTFVLEANTTFYCAVKMIK